MLHPSPLPCVLDIEASGFGRSSYPIEVGYVLPDGRAACMLVRPARQWTHWDAGAERVHGITRSVLVTHGRDVREVALALNRNLHGHTVYCDGWAHDYSWLAALFEEAGLSPSFKLESVGALLDDEHLARLDQARRDAVAELGLTRHRASSDARALQRALGRMAAACRVPGLSRPPHSPVSADPGSSTVHWPLLQSAARIPADRCNGARRCSAGRPLTYASAP